MKSCTAKPKYSKQRKGRNIVRQAGIVEQHTARVNSFRVAPPREVCLTRCTYCGTIYSLEDGHDC